tara:strand:- start:5726 stop:6028 length:303 start_codon:yes stop_codon:yes gene_type:complete
MIKNPSYSAKVKMSEEKNTAAWSPANPHAVSNVNQAQGPRTGNASARDGKRAMFVEEKQTRVPLADMVTNAFAGRGSDLADHVRPGLEPISSNSRRRFKK